MYRIRRFGIVKTATVVTVLYMVASAIFIVPLGLIAAAANPNNAGSQAVPFIVGGLLFIVLYGVIGWIITAIGCAIYNLVGSWMGGIEVQIEPVGPGGGDTLWTPTAPIAPPSPPAAPAG
jgi:hypothetical protein